MAIQRENLQTSMEIVTSTYSSDMRNLIMYLLTNPTRVKSVNDLMPMIGARFYDAIDESNARNDLLEADLAKDIESTRLFRLLTKLCTVVYRRWEVGKLRTAASWLRPGNPSMRLWQWFLWLAVFLHRHRCCGHGLCTSDLYCDESSTGNHQERPEGRREQSPPGAQGARGAPVQHAHFPHSGGPGLLRGLAMVCIAIPRFLLRNRGPDQGGSHPHHDDHWLCGHLRGWILRLVE